MFSKHLLRAAAVPRSSSILLPASPSLLLLPASPSLPSWLPCSSTASPPPPPQKNLIELEGITILNGLPHITIPLPSRDEKCVFALKPISNNVGDFLSMLKEEDKGIDRAVIKNSSGVRIASKTSIQTLFDQEFTLHINHNEYLVQPPPIDESMSKEELRKMSDVKALVSQLYEALHIEEYQLAREKDIVTELEMLQKELEPLEEQRAEIVGHAEERTCSVTWLGLGLMSIQFGILARLTWWEYSWDIMEPVTYFVTYGTAIAGYAYFVMTRQEFLYPDATNRQRLLTFHKKAQKHRWDVDRYNSLKQGISGLEADLRRVRDPLSIHTGGQQKKKVSAGLFNIGNFRDMVSKMQ